MLDCTPGVGDDTWLFHGGGGLRLDCAKREDPWLPLGYLRLLFNHILVDWGRFGTWSCMWLMLNFAIGIRGGCLIRTSSSIKYLGCSFISPLKFGKNATLCLGSLGESPWWSLGCLWVVLDHSLEVWGRFRTWSCMIISGWCLIVPWEFWEDIFTKTLTFFYWPPFWMKC